MKTKILFCLAGILLLLAALPALAQDIVYTAVVTKDMTIRQTQSTSGKKLGSVSEGDIVYILKYDEQWCKIDQEGLVGYILSKNVDELALAYGYNDKEAALYAGYCQKSLTIRQKKSKSSMRMNALEEGDTVFITELGKEWLGVVKNGVPGYVLASGVSDITPLREGLEVPEEYLPEEPFAAVYTAIADVNLSIRKEKDAKSTLLGTVYQDESVDVNHIEDGWAQVKKGRETGWVRADHLRYFNRYDPYGPMVPGTVWYPYAARVTTATFIYDNETGDILRIVPADTVLTVSAIDENLCVTLPYDRITGRIEDIGNLEFEVVAPWNEAEYGDLIAVFTTFYDPEMRTQTQTGRLHNIMQGVERVGGVMVRSGEKFYFNDYCAPYSKGNGYQLGPIINYVSSNKLGYGGGICQVSTTLYNAIAQIPILVIKHCVHSAYGISYAPLDFDAAVGAGNIDLRLQNTLPYDIRFELMAEGGVLTCRVYRVE